MNNKNFLLVFLSVAIHLCNAFLPTLPHLHVLSYKLPNVKMSTESSPEKPIPEWVGAKKFSMKDR